MNKRILITAVPIVICNLIAFTGQLAFIRAHMSWPLIGDVGLAAGIESIALFLAYMAHDALIHEDSAIKLRIGSYLAAGVAAALNYSHYADHGSPNFAAVATAFMSFMSPVLWGIYSRRISRDALKSKGLIESRSVKFSTARWIWWPRFTFGAFRLAVLHGETSPERAISDYESEQITAEELQPEPQETREDIADARNKTAAVRIALREIPGKTSVETAAWLQARGWDIKDDFVRSVRSADSRKESERQRAGIHAITSGQDTGTNG